MFRPVWAWATWTRSGTRWLRRLSNGRRGRAAHRSLFKAETGGCERLQGVGFRQIRMCSGRTSRDLGCSSLGGFTSASAMPPRASWIRRSIWLTGSTNGSHNRVRLRLGHTREHNPDRGSPTGARDIAGLVAAGDLEEIERPNLANREFGGMIGWVGALMESREGWERVMKKHRYAVISLRCANGWHELECTVVGPQSLGTGR